MKYLKFSSVILLVLFVGFFLWTWRFPYHLGWQSENAVGYYKFQIVAYGIDDYGHRNNVGVFAHLGTTSDFVQYLLKMKTAEEIGMTRL